MCHDHKILIHNCTCLETRAKKSVRENGLTNVEVKFLIHPSPASPAANAGWSDLAFKTLNDLNVIHLIKPKPDADDTELVKPEGDDKELIKPEPADFDNKLIKPVPNVTELINPDADDTQLIKADLEVIELKKRN